ncbi:MAG: CHAD domain-containing protein [Burkholderiales bacterium]|nr:CHAD domain-containing protein [Burkholderiales bacterium]
MSHRELELKFSLPLVLQDKLDDDAANAWDRKRVWSCYYDTPDGELTRARMAVRVRRHGERWLQTVKAEGAGQFERYEWERAIDGPEPHRDALPPADTELGAIAHRSFGLWRPLFETDFERRSRSIEPSPGLVIEIAQDIGELRCGDRTEAIREVELECLQGGRAEFFEWALDWAKTLQACLLIPTKNERGLRLAARLPLIASPLKAPATVPGRGQRPGAAAAQILSACIAHACSNIEPILSSDAPEGPHQFRVALRRFRAALRFFGLREIDPVWETLDRTASSLADAAGRVRDFDVFESGLLPELRSRFKGDAALEALSRAVGHARESARMDLRRTLSGPDASQFVLQVTAMAERLADTGNPAGLPGDDFGAFAAVRLPALMARVRRRARQARTEADWHRARIAVKNLRYALEFAALALTRSADVPRVTAALARWQDELGAGQDLAVARDVAAQAMARPGVPSEAAVRATALIDAWRVFSAPRPHGRQRIARRSLQVLQALSAAISASRAPPPVDEHAIANASETGDAAAGQDDESPSPKSDPPAAMQ